MRQIQTHQISNWPKLAWVARIMPTSQPIEVYHGPMVEIAKTWCVEAVWAGDFEKADFDKTDLIFGTGIKLLDDGVVFVNSGTTTDRLWYSTRDGIHYVSNTLPGLLAISDDSLLENRNYWLDIRTICRGLEYYARTIPATLGDIGVVYFDNLFYDGTKLLTIDKPDRTPCFRHYEEYYSFLCQTAQKIGKNARSPERCHKVLPLGTISTGYDACATAVIARYAGCRKVVTMRQSSSLWRGSDSGENIASHFGLQCKVYNTKTKHYAYEAAFWAASGRAFLLNWAQLDYPEPLCLFFTGCRGDAVWNYGTDKIPDPFSVPSVGDLGIAEFRLIRGLFHCPVPFWGIRRIADLRTISVSSDMRPWSLVGDYNRPIARRIIEEAGVPRNVFAQRKKNTALSSYFLWPYSPDAITSFRRYIKSRGLLAPPTWIIHILKAVSNVDMLFYLNVTGKLGLVHGDVGLRRLISLKANNLLFHWGNWELKRMYAEALHDSTN